MKIFETVAAMFDLKEAEIRTGITIVEAVATQERLVELRMIGDPNEILDVAIEAAKLGLKLEDLAPMARSWYLAQNRFQRLAIQANGYADEFSNKGTL